MSLEPEGTPSRVVLITGCSSGIGAATALRLQRAGWTVYATARQLASMAHLEEAGCHVLPLDMTDDASMQRAVERVDAEAGGIGVLVNNAGYSQSGAIEEVPIESIRRQFETNVFGLVRLTQLVLPTMRAQRRGRIVNIGSMGGRFTLPGGGIYHATKHAVEAVSDALRFEVQAFGINVVLIQPGLIRTEFPAAAVKSIERLQRERGPYAHFTKAIERITREAYLTGRLARFGGSPEDVAAVIEDALQAKEPKARYRVTPSASLMLGLRAVLPDSLWDGFLARTYPRPGLPETPTRKRA